MKTRILLFAMMVLFFLASAMKVSAQEKAAITVKGSVVTNGVVVVDVVKGGKGYDLQCNQGAPSCVQIKSGKYQLVELPSNSGMYECRDVQVFPEGADTEDSDKKIGEYCLTDK
ncbi:MAG: hypothetical protein WCC04_10080 [Terriglobales bacterium]